LQIAELHEEIKNLRSEIVTHMQARIQIEDEVSKLCSLICKLSERLQVPVSSICTAATAAVPSKNGTHVEALIREIEQDAVLRKLNKPQGRAALPINQYLLNCKEKLDALNA
jgi:hypothetical protein